MGSSAWRNASHLAAMTAKLTLQLVQLPTDPCPIYAMARTIRSTATEPTRCFYSPHELSCPNVHDIAPRLALPIRRALFPLLDLKTEWEGGQSCLEVVATKWQGRTDAFRNFRTQSMCSATSRKQSTSSGSPMLKMLFSHGFCGWWTTQSARILV